MDLLSWFWHYGVIFLVVITLVVFVHEMGHYLVARRNGVKVEVFSIGFGPELFGWTAKSGTRWRIAALPLGGYVRMFGDADEASAGAPERELTDEEKAVSFRHKRVGQRAAIVVAGPAANFLFTIVCLALMFMVTGQQVIEPLVGSVQPDSAAAEAGLKPGDRFIAIDGTQVERFQDIQRIVRLNLDRPLEVTVERGGERLTVVARPRVIERKGVFGDAERVPVLGIGADQEKVRLVKYGPVTALLEAVRATEEMLHSTLVGIGQMIFGSRPADEIGGPLRIAKLIGDAAQHGLSWVVLATIHISFSLGLINLFPIPVLDGGHLLFYAIEALRGRPLGEKAQEYGFRIGLFLVLALMVFATGNDIVFLRVWDAVKRWLS